MHRKLFRKNNIDNKKKKIGVPNIRFRWKDRRMDIWNFKVTSLQLNSDLGYMTYT